MNGISSSELVLEKDNEYVKWQYYKSRNSKEFIMYLKTFRAK